MPQGDLRLHEFAASEVGAKFLAAPQVKTTSIPPLPPQPSNGIARIQFLTDYHLSATLPVGHLNQVPQPR